MSDSSIGDDQTANREPAEGGRDEVDDAPAAAGGAGDAAGGTELIANTGDDAESEAPSG